MTATKPCTIKRRRYLRFSVRTLLVIVTVVAVVLAVPVRRAMRQREAVLAIQKLGGSLIYDYEITRGPETMMSAWLRRTLGDDYFHDVYLADFPDRPIADSDLSHLS